MYLVLYLSVPAVAGTEDNCRNYFPLAQFQYAFES